MAKDMRTQPTSPNSIPSWLCRQISPPLVGSVGKSVHPLLALSANQSTLSWLCRQISPPLVGFVGKSVHPLLALSANQSTLKANVLAVRMSLNLPPCARVCHLCVVTFNLVYPVPSLIQINQPMPTSEERKALFPLTDSYLS